MAVRLKSKEVERLSPFISAKLEAGKSKAEICKELDIYMGAINLYLRKFGSERDRLLALDNGRGV